MLTFARTFIMDRFLQQYFRPLLALGIVLNATGIFTQVFTGDSILYADIAKNMAQRNDWLNLFAYGKDWLDKPHFPFWMAAISFKIFGINAFGYKLPAFLFWLTGIYYTYKIAAKLYNNVVAKCAVLVYVIALHGVISNFDVKAEPYLTTLIIAATYYILLAYREDKLSYILMAALFSGFAVMTKGIFVLLTIAGGLALYFILSRQWKEFFKVKWYLLIVLILLVIFPELYALYTQFDLHPEKVVFDKQNVSGIQFFLWDSQFGRFFNTGPIKGSGDNSFFLHTTLWAFLPWSVIFLFALLKGAKQLKLTGERWILYGAALLTFLIFSVSDFQLPHYIIILFPHFSIAVAAYLSALAKTQTARNLAIVQFVLFCLSVVFIILLSWLINNPGKYIVMVAGIIIAGVCFLFTMNKKDSLHKTMLYSFAFACVLYPFMNLYFYPFLMQYQAGMKAAQDVNLTQERYEHAMDHYSTQYRFYGDKEPVTLTNMQDVSAFLEKENPRIFITQPTLDSLRMMNTKFNILKAYNDFHVTKLSLNFLRDHTRENTLKKCYIITSVK